MPRKQYRVRITGDQREHIDPHQIAQILLDLLGPAQVEALAAQAERPDRTGDSRVWQEEGGERPRW
ncbi:hypothetical protein [Glycomyces paridis]|uniref:Uncharacterized protein n=1 Tax=Glycomyces paridis TaxID=2126555 RepID=A0A4S8NYT7_9ACTN|nr:hypothetical protein [Glycomyces paridis]THV22081.1 hypothetical protein E9998_23985 [Glycomyces paridis]